MADWNELRNFIRANWPSATEDEFGGIRFTFNLQPKGGGTTRSQIVVVSNVRDTGWAQIATPVCQEHEIAPRDALIRSASMDFGGLVLYGRADGHPGIVMFRHAFWLADLDPAEFQHPLFLSAALGDKLERELSAGGDIW